MDGRLRILSCWQKVKRCKNVNHMMVNHDIASVWEFMLCTLPQIRLERFFLQLIKKKITCLNKFPPELAQNNNSALFMPPLPPPIKFEKTFPPTNMSRLKSWPPPLQRGEEETMKYNFWLQIYLSHYMPIQTFSKCFLNINVNSEIY